MPDPRVIPVPFHEDTLRRLARDLLDASPGAGRGDLSDALVLLPSSRVCRDLSHALLDEAGTEALLLPRIVTLGQWTAETAVLAGLPDRRRPDDRTRALVLAADLARLPWLADRPESAPGLARELVGFFDEARLAEQADRLLAPGSGVDDLPGVSAAEAPVVEADLARVGEAWRLYRARIPHDDTDLLVEVADFVTDRAPAPVVPPALVLAAGFGRVDAVRARLLRAALATGEEGRLYVPAAADPLSRAFLATWGAEPAPTDPLAPARQAARLVAGVDPDVVPRAAATLRERLADFDADGLAADLLAPSGPLEIRPCPDPETESRVVADRVVEAVRTHGPTHRVTVAVNDPRLAARIRSQVVDAGLDVDHTHGEPVAALPAGLLVRFILRAALTDLRAEPLLDVLTHPDVALPVAEGRHATWVRRLEQMFRLGHGPRGGLAALYRRADERDQAVLNLVRDFDAARGAGMVDFVTRVADAFAPLQPLADGRPRPWSAYLAALRETWSRFAPDVALDADGRERADVARAAALLDALERDADLLPETTLAGFAADLGSLLAAENAAAHRRPHLPVVITGLVEARLARCDTLIVAGLQDGVFPTRSRRPLLLGGALRARLGLPAWTEGLARDAELFARLLHAAPRVLLTWSQESDGAPALPSAFVSRLDLVLQPDAEPLTDAPLWRREAPDPAALAAAERLFLAAARDLRALVPVRPLTRLSWSALRTWRDCPYRFLLERGFALRREEEVQEEFRAMDYGKLVHGALETWLDPEGPGYAAVAAGDAVTALEVLDAAAAARFEPGAAEMPQRRLWLETFRRIQPGLVRTEIARFADWRPIALERVFELPLTTLRDWARAQAAAAGIEADWPAGDDLDEAILLRGTVDRIDRAQDGTGALSVLDYKTGSAPSVKSVKNLDDLQVLLYAAAAELGVLDLPGETGDVSNGAYYAVTTKAVGPPTKPHLPEGDEGRRLLAEGCGRLVVLAREAASPEGPFGLLPREDRDDAPSRLPCDHCDFRGVCRVEELATRPGTVRKLDKLVNRKDN